MRISSTDLTRAQSARMIDLVRGAKGQMLSVVPHKRTLEDVFVETVRKEDAYADTSLDEPEAARV